jgi:hypothetical protein
MGLYDQAKKKAKAAPKTSGFISKKNAKALGGDGRSWSKRAVTAADKYNKQQKAVSGVMDYSLAALGSGMGGGQQTPSYGPSGGYGGGGSGGGGGGSKALDDPYKEYRAQLEAKLNEMKAAVPGALQGYLNNYNATIGRIGADNAGLTQGYTNDISTLLSNILSQAGTARDGLMQDLQSQGADTRALGAQAQASAQGQQMVSGNADVYNRRLAQLQQLAQADRQGMGAAINQAGLGAADQSYMNALIQIAGMR